MLTIPAALQSISAPRQPPADTGRDGSSFSMLTAVIRGFDRLFGLEPAAVLAPIRLQGRARKLSTMR